MGMPLDQQRLLKRMTTLALWRGILIGGALTFIVLDFVNGWLQRTGTPIVTEPLAHLFEPLITILLGGAIVVIAR